MCCHFCNKKLQYLKDNGLFCENGKRNCDFALCSDCVAMLDYQQLLNVFIIATPRIEICRRCYDDMQL